MDIFLMAMLLGMGMHFFKVRYQAGRIALLSRYLGQYQIEKLMESLTQGYLRALGESDAERRNQILSMLEGAEVSLYEQFNRFAADLAKLTDSEARISKLPIAIAHADQMFPAATFDLRAVMKIHAQGIEAVVRNELGRSARDKAFMLTAELLLMQHSCHWFCKSKTIASARMVARHQTSHEQALAAVSPATRRAYLQLLAD
ncbi:MAG: hypothetical protein KA216_02085 [Giesbergeria sp.]|nr:hypothetical protein [Giesbergeria sp.]